jgi:hypothetical protein
MDWKIYRKDKPLRPDGTAEPIWQVEAADRRDALDKAETKFGPDSRGWLYAVKETTERRITQDKITRYGTT